MLCGDLVSDLEYMTRPYEVSQGATDQALRRSMDLLYEVFRDRPYKGHKWDALAWHVLTRYYVRALRRIRSFWDEVEVDRLQVRPMVKITGEFWLQTHEGDGNYNMKRWLESEGAEVRVPPIAAWLDYWMRFYVQEMEARTDVDRSAALRARGIRVLQRVYRAAYNRLRRALGGLPPELPDQYELQRLARPYFHQRLSGGEGDMLVAKALHTHHHRTAHMICELNPYSCMPNTMSVGAMAQVLGDHPDLLYAPIEVKGDAEVHAQSRCQMILTDARKRAEQEFEEALAATGLTVERIRRWEKGRPHATRATYPFSHAGVAGTAARYVHHAARRGA
jgi:predicted nucleotide-binding protein (sugar kinase/HSP70/actin superfamily)